MFQLLRRINFHEISTGILIVKYLPTDANETQARLKCLRNVMYVVTYVCNITKDFRFILSTQTRAILHGWTLVPAAGCTRHWQCFFVWLCLYAGQFSCQCQPRFPIYLFFGYGIVKRWHWVSTPNEVIILVVFLILYGI